MVVLNNEGLGICSISRMLKVPKEYNPQLVVAEGFLENNAACAKRTRPEYGG